MREIFRGILSPTLSHSFVVREGENSGGSVGCVLRSTFEKYYFAFFRVVPHCLRKTSQTNRGKIPP